MGEIRFVGLDVHKESITIAVAEQAGGPPQTVATVPHELRSLLKQLGKLASVGPLRCCYEAGPTGFGRRRALQKEGIDCVVIAPSLTPKQPGDRVKTDRRDAEKLARFHRSGDLTEVYILRRSHHRDEAHSSFTLRAFENIQPKCSHEKLSPRPVRSVAALRAIVVGVVILLGLGCRRLGLNP